MKFISWNVNGFRACLEKGFWDSLSTAERGFFLPAGDEDAAAPDGGGTAGLSSVLVFCGKEGLLRHGCFCKAGTSDGHLWPGVEELDHEGRIITLEYPDFYVVTNYTPNAQEGLKRLDFRMAWDDAYRAHLSDLDQKKPVIACGDFNVAHQEIDIKNPGPNRGHAGFSDEEREKFSALLEAGFVDTFRYRNPDVVNAYSWWSYRFHARENNAGWRIDYFLTSERLKEQILSAPIYAEITGSDHCPVGLTLALDNIV